MTCTNFPSATVLSMRVHKMKTGPGPFRAEPVMMFSVYPNPARETMPPVRLRALSAVVSVDRHGVTTGLELKTRPFHDPASSTSDS